MLLLEIGLIWAFLMLGVPKVTMNPLNGGKPCPSLETLEWVKGGPVAVGGGKLSVVVFCAKFAKGDYTTVQGCSVLQEKYPDVQFFGVFTDPAKSDTEGFVKKIGTSMPEIYIDELKVAFPIAWDNGKTVKEGFRKEAAMGALGASATFVIDGEGVIVWREQFGQGYAPDKKGQLDEQIRRLIAGEELIKNGPKPAAEEEESEEEEMAMGGDDDYDDDLGF